MYMIAKQSLSLKQKHGRGDLVLDTTHPAACEAWRATQDHSHGMLTTTPGCSASRVLDPMHAYCSNLSSVWQATPPKAMLKLPAHRLEPPQTEPSQAICPHWILTVLHQAVREVYYISMDTKGALAVTCCCYTPPIDPTIYRPLADSTPEPPKQVLFVRHGQGAHNATIQNWGFVDPEPTMVGESQVQTPTPAHRATGYAQLYSYYS